MHNQSENLKNLLSLYNEKLKISKDDISKLPTVSDVVGAIFSPGDYYYFITNFFDVRFEYVHPTIERIIGYKPEEFELPQLFECMHPDDAAQMQLKETAAIKFFFQKISIEKIPLYKSTYTFRLRNPLGGWKNILHQSMAITVTEGKIHRSLVIHSDISHLNLLPNNRISFIGLNGEPSFYSLSTDPDTLLQPEREWTLSDREKQVIKLLAEGHGSKQIGDMLSISSHTVDTHRQNLLQKTGSKNTLELTVNCIKRGLL